MYVKGQVARPLQAAPPRPLEDLLQGRAREQYVNFVVQQLLRGDAVAPLSEEQKVIRPYWDPVLGTDQAAYTDFVIDLTESHMLNFTMSPLDFAAFFFVKKKTVASG